MKFEYYSSILPSGPESVKLSAHPWGVIFWGHYSFRIFKRQLNTKCSFISSMFSKRLVEKQSTFFLLIDTILRTIRILLLCAVCLQYISDHNFLTFKSISEFRHFAVFLKPSSAHHLLKLINVMRCFSLPFNLTCEASFPHYVL